MWHNAAPFSLNEGSSSLQTIWNGGTYQTRWLRQVVERVTALCAHPALPWLLLLLGGVRGVFLLLAYPPAHGADSIAYFAYAEHLSGFNIPLISEAVPPLYGMLIFVAHKVLGSIYWLIGLQFLMGAALTPIYYLALKRYSPIFALLVALVVLGDVQTAVVFNFTSTESLYIFLLALTFSLTLRQMDAVRRLGLADGLLGGLLALMLLTRAVARFLIVPFALIFALRTRSLRRTLVLIAGFGVVYALNASLTTLLVGSVDGVSSSNRMTLDVTREEGGVRVVAENGPNTAQYLEIRATCDDKIYTCLEQATGSWNSATALMTAMTLETVAANWQVYITRTWDKTLDFLSLSGQQVGNDPLLPGEAQCADPEAAANTIDATFLRRSSWGWTLADLSEERLAELRERFRPVYSAMCPMLPASPALRTLVDEVAFRYRSLGRPQPHLWYGVVFALALLVPWVRRRYLSVVLTAGALLFNHALISALLVNIQPRYVVVINTMRTVLLVLLILVVVKLVVYALDTLFARLASTPSDIRQRPRQLE